MIKTWKERLPDSYTKMGMPLTQEQGRSAMQEEIDELRAELAALKAQEAAATYIGSCHEGDLVQLHEDVKKGTKLYAAAGAALKQEPIGYVAPDNYLAICSHKIYADYLPVYLAAGTAPIPPGYALVPAEPTPEMCRVKTWDFNKFYSASQIYKDMLAAAPKEPT